jgi:hypothetical protein
MNTQQQPTDCTGSEKVDASCDAAANVYEYAARLTPRQVEGLRYKIEIMQQDGCDDGTVAYEYGFTVAALDSFADKVAQSNGTLHLTAAEYEAAVGELQNCLDIARDNARRDPTWKPEVVKFRDAIRRLMDAEALRA